jgi:RNA polymerase sigma-70 factor (sigma-E family)
MGQSPQNFETAFPDLYRRAYSAAFTILGRRAEAEDLAQEALARTYLRWEKVASYATPFVLRVTTNLVIDKLRRHTMARRLFTRPAADEESADRIDLQRALLRLPERQRNVVVLRYVCDLPESEVAIVLGCTIGTVKTHASRGLASLRRTLKPVQFMADQETEKRL